MSSIASWKHVYQLEKSIYIFLGILYCMLALALPVVALWRLWAVFGSLFRCGALFWGLVVVCLFWCGCVATGAEAPSTSEHVSTWINTSQDSV